ncbi:MAG: DUF2235 domain-containing protein [Pseudomonadota bacterium]
MGKALIVFSDGTGNKGGVTNDTNVWRLYQMLDRSGGDQLTFYDDGVGTQTFSPIKAVSGAVGWGISRNIRQAYTFLVKNYESGDRIYMFGFSRGAYTVRCLLGMLNQCGLVRRQDGDTARSSQSIDALVMESFKAYRALDRHKAEEVKRRNQSVPIHFIGVWDTVDAVGLPFDKFLYWGLRIPYALFGKRPYKFRDQIIGGTRYARQALAIDDERLTFHPNYWQGRGSDGTQVPGSENADPPKVDVDQVWFAGVHSNCGGSYPKDGLAYVTLDWMIGELLTAEEAVCVGNQSQPASDGKLKLRHDDVQKVRDLANDGDNLYDSREGIAAFYRYSPRRLAEFATTDQPIRIHVSVLERIRRRVQDYAPLFIQQVEGVKGGPRLAFTASLGRDIGPSRYALPGMGKGKGGAVKQDAEESDSGKQDAGEEFPTLPLAVDASLKRQVWIRRLVFSVFFSLTLLGLLLGLTIEPLKDWTAVGTEEVVMLTESFDEQSPCARLERDEESGLRKALEEGQCATVTIDATRKNRTGIWLEADKAYRYEFGEHTLWQDKGIPATPAEGHQTSGIVDWFRHTSYLPDANFMELVGLVDGDVFSIGALSDSGNTASPGRPGELVAFTNEPVWADCFFENNTGTVELTVTALASSSAQKNDAEPQTFHDFRAWMAGMLKAILPGAFEQLADNAASFWRYSLFWISTIVLMYASGRTLKKRMNEFARKAWDERLD